jgi:hypothetical protein
VAVACTGLLDAEPLSGVRRNRVNAGSCAVYEGRRRGTPGRAPRARVKGDRPAERRALDGAVRQGRQSHPRRRSAGGWLRRGRSDRRARTPTWLRCATAGTSGGCGDRRSAGCFVRT